MSPFIFLYGVLVHLERRSDFVSYAAADAQPTSEFPILQALDHQARTKPPRIRTPSPPPPPPRPPARARSPDKSRKAPPSIRLSELPLPPPLRAVQPPSPVPRPVPAASSAVSAQRRRPSPGPAPGGFSAHPISSSSSMAVSSFPLPVHHQQRQDGPVRPPSPPIRFENESADLYDYEDRQQTDPRSHPTLPPPTAVYRLPDRGREQAEPQWMYGEDGVDVEPQAMDEGGFDDWNQQAPYDGSGTMEPSEPKRRFASSRPSEGWRGVREDIAVASGAKGKRRASRTSS